MDLLTLALSKRMAGEGGGANDPIIPIMPPAKIENLFANPYFEEPSGDTGVIPSLSGWIHTESLSADETVRYIGRNTAHFLASDFTWDKNAGIYQTMSIDPGKTYNASFMVMSPNTRTIDSEGIIFFILFKREFEGWSPRTMDNRIFTLADDNQWEKKSLSFTSPNDAIEVRVGIGCSRNGDVYFAAPSLSEALPDNNVFIRKKDNTAIEAVDASGMLLGTITLDEYRV